eukprot:gene14224-16783_t
MVSILCLVGTQANLIYDYIVVGSGAAGSIVASRLAANGDSVLVIEAGAASTSDYDGDLVAGTQGMVDGTNTYEPLKELTQYEVPLYWSSTYLTGVKWDIDGAGVAKVMGGCSMHNGMVFQRGKQADYNGWGVSGWGWTDMFPIIKRLETILDPPLAGSALHGHSGRIKVGTHPFDKEGSDFLASCTAAGLPFNSDFQQDTRDGCGYFQFNINQKGIRSSSLQEYLTPADNMYPNLDVLKETTVLRVLIDTNLLGQKVAKGVRTIRNSNGNIINFFATKEVILSAGALNTPKLLLNSGVGDATYLATLSSKIPVVNSNLPGVGQNLQNHFLAFTVWQYTDISQRPTFYDLFSQSLAYQTSGGGILGTPGFSVGAWLRPNATATEAENVMLVMPGTLGTTTPFPALSIGVSIAYPAPNTHYIRLNADSSGTQTDFFLRKPDLHFTLSNMPADVDTLVRGIKESRRIMSYAPMSSLATPMVPPASVSSDADLSAWVINNTIAHEHWCCTAKMGASSDPNAVVDNRLRVFGIKNLRVVDASVIPKIPHSLVHVTVMAIAEKAADIIIADNP